MNTKKEQSHKTRTWTALLLACGFNILLAGPIQAQSLTNDVDVAIVPLGETSFVVSGASDAASQRTNIVEVRIDGGNLILTGKQPGFASIKFTVGGTIYSRGVAVKNQDGSMPGLPAYVALGSRSLMGWAEHTDENWYRDGGGGLSNRWTDIVDIYMNAGPDTWVDNWPGNGAYLDNFLRGCKRQGRIPCIVFYCIPPAWTIDSEVVAMQSVNDPAYMQLYFQRSIRTLIARIKAITEADGWPVLLVMEPDFIGYMAQKVIGPQKLDPDTNRVTYQAVSYTFRVDQAYTNTATTDAPLLSPADGVFHNSLSGLVTSLNYILHRDLPANVKFGWKYNIWASPDTIQGFSGAINYPGSAAWGGSGNICRWTDAANNDMTVFGNITNKLVTEVRGIADFYKRCGVLTNGSSFIVMDRYGQDGGSHAVTDPASYTYFWNADHWNNYLLFAKTLREETSFPIVLWQIPMGHINTSTRVNPVTSQAYVPLANTNGCFEDSAQTFFLGDEFRPGDYPTKGGGAVRLAYFRQNLWGDPMIGSTGDILTWRSHIPRLAEIGVVALLCAPGVGVDHSTYGAIYSGGGPYDDSWWITQAQQYYASFAGLSATNLYGDADSDGVSNFKECVALQSNPLQADSMVMGVRDGEVLRMNAVSLNNFFTGVIMYMPGHMQGLQSVLTNPIPYGLFSSNSIQDVSMGGLMFRVAGETARIQLQLQSMDKLNNTWQDAGSPVEWSIPMTNGSDFFRVRAKSAP